MPNTKLSAKPEDVELLRRFRSVFKQVGMTGEAFFCEFNDKYLPASNSASMSAVKCWIGWAKKSTGISFINGKNLERWIADKCRKHNIKP